MNKRKAKKRLKKCFTPLVDEFGMVTMSDEERKVFRKSIQTYSLRHFSYKHYKDKEKAFKKAVEHPAIYTPLGRGKNFFLDREYGQDYIINISRFSRAKIDTVIVFQNMEQLREAYDEAQKLNTEI